MSQTIVKGQSADELVGAPAPGKTSYDYLFILTEKDGWQCWETTSDSSAFGIWINREALHIFKFKNGERELVVAHDHASFDAEIARLEKIYGTEQPRQQFIVEAKGEVTLIMNWMPRGSGVMFA